MNNASSITKRNISLLLLVALVLTGVVSLAKQHKLTLLEVHARSVLSVPPNWECVSESSENAAGIIFYDPVSELYCSAIYCKRPGGLQWSLIRSGSLLFSEASVLAFEPSAGEWFYLSLNGLNDSREFTFAAYQTEQGTSFIPLTPGMPFVLSLPRNTSFYDSQCQAAESDRIAELSLGLPEEKPTRVP